MEQQPIINDYNADLTLHEKQEDIWQSPFKDPIYLIGLAMLAISYFLFLAGYNKTRGFGAGGLMPINLIIR